MIRVEIPAQLLACARPGYDFGRNEPVSGEPVKAWLKEVKAQGARSILCLLAAQHLKLYDHALPGGLLAAYRQEGLEVSHAPVGDHRKPPLTERQLRRVFRLFERLPKPVLVHCSAGLDRPSRERHIPTAAGHTAGRCQQGQSRQPGHSNGVVLFLA